MKELVNNSRFTEHPKQIKGISFGLLSPHEITELSELEICNRELYQHPTFPYPSIYQDGTGAIPSTTQHTNPSTISSTPMPYGCLDRRLGISDKTSTCETCGQRLSDCVGHFGHIILALPVFHIGYFKAILTILQCVCKSCSSLLLTQEQCYFMLRKLRNSSLDSLQRASILKRIHVMCKSITTCPSCGSFNGAVKKVGALKIVHEKYISDTKKYRKKDKISVNTRKRDVNEFRESFQHVISTTPELAHLIPRAQEDLDPIKCHTIFKNISDEDCELLGMNPFSSRPEQFIWKTLPVPPACIRPSVEQDNGSNEDDITIKLTEIIYTNIVIKDALQKGSPINMIMEDWDFLQLQCAMYIHSELPGIPPSIAASSYNNSTGKPVRGFCQRLKGKAGRFRGNLSGKRVDFSSRTVISPDPNLQIGQVGVPVYIAQTLTYPERVCQTNIHKLQQLIKNGPDMHPGANFVQHASTGFKKSLKYGNRDKIAQEIRIGDIVERHMMDGDIVLFNRQPSLHKLSIMAHSVKVQPWRTFRLNECECLPYGADFDGDEMNLHLPQTEEARAESLILMSVQENLVTPRHGQLVIAAIQDFITNAFLLSSKDVLLTRSEFCQLISYFSLHEDGDSKSIFLPMPSIIKPERLWTGKQLFSVLIRFSVCETKSNNPHLIQLESRTRLFDSYSSKLPSPLLCPKEGYLIIQDGHLLLGRLDKGSIGGDGGKHSLLYIILKEYGPKSATKAMTCLSRLSSRWIGKRGFSIGLDDVQPSAHLREMKSRFIEQGYKTCDEQIAKYHQGSIAFSEYIIPGCTMEQSLETTISRVLSKIREDVGQLCIEKLDPKNAPLLMQWCGSKGSKINVSQMVACVGQQIIGGSRIPDGFFDRSLPHFVPNAKTPAAKGFVQSSFYSGLSPTEFFFHAMSGREGLVDTAVKTAETGYMQRRLMKALEDLSVHYDNTVRNSVGGIIQFRYGDDGLDPSCMETSNMSEGGPVYFERLWLQACLYRDKMYMNTKDIKTESLSEYADEFLKSDITKEIPASFIDNIKAFLKSQPVIKYPSKLFPSIEKHQLDWFLRSCIDKYIRARIEPGTAVGALGAQSIGEPGTQMTLKTFHFAGVAGMNVTLGVPRIKEIINANKKIHTPIITAPLNIHDTVNVMDSMKACKSRIERTLIENVSFCIETVLPEGIELPYLMIHIDEERLKKRHLELSLADICERLVVIFNIKSSSREHRLHDIKVVPGGIQCRLSHMTTEFDVDKNSSYYDKLMQYKKILPKVIIQGISTVQRVVINQEKDNEKGYHLLVEGTGLQQVMTTEGIDGLSTTSNHMMDVQQVLGIEAVRSTIINEIQYTMGKHGMTIDIRHVTLLADIMTFKGEILGITRFGISKMKDSVLMLASFEKTTEHLFDAAHHGKVDNISGVSECIIMGTPMPLGTGMFQMMFQQRNDSTKVTAPVKESKWLFDD